MLDLDKERPAVTPKDAATIILVRDRAGVDPKGRASVDPKGRASVDPKGRASVDPKGRASVEVFCVERSKQSRFMGGAVVFPGGKLDESDRDERWRPLASSPSRRGAPPFTDDEAHLYALSVAACRETLEEAAMLPVVGGALAHEELLALRKDLAADPAALRTLLLSRGLRLDLEALHPFARWITPTAESRRFDARFFVAVAPAGQAGAHDEHETMASFWATPLDVLARFDAGDVQLMPPTHRTLTLLATCASTADVLSVASSTCLDPICPRLVPQPGEGGDTMALTLPGDPEHDVREARVPGPSRYVLRGAQWRAEDAPR